MLTLNAFVLALSLAGAPADKPAAKPAAPAAGPEIIKRGAALTGAAAVPLKKVVETPAAFAGKTVRVTAEVKKACSKKGCWMELAEGDATVRVTFKDYGFFVPLDSAGSSATCEGVVEVKKLDKDQATHLANEGAHLKVNADGSAEEIGFVATGVELKKPAKS